jgi:transposase
VNLAQARGESLTPRRVARFQRRYAAIAAAGLAFHEALPPLPARGSRGCPRRRTGHHLLLRLSTRRDDVLRFLTDPRVPFTNNLAEQAARMMKLRQKISGGFRSEQGARDFAVIRSVIATAKKQGWNVIHTLTQPPALLVAQLRTE